MRGFSLRHFFLVLVGVGLTGLNVAAQQDAFHWIDFHSEKDQTYVVWVTRALADEKWTAIREIGVLYDAALVVTTTRANAEASPADDTFNVWSVNLKTHAKTPLLKGVNLRWLEMMQIAAGQPREIAALYDDCRDCAATTYFTTFHYDYSQHIFAPRWMRGGQAVPVWSSTSPQGVTVTQAYAVLEELNGQQEMATWSHYDYGQEKDPEDYVFRFDVDPQSGLERTELLSNKDGEAMKQRICSVQGAPASLARGQSGPMCQEMAHGRPERKPVTTPPAHNRGRSVPPGTRRQAPS